MATIYDPLDYHRSIDGILKEFIEAQLGIEVTKVIISEQDISPLIPLQKPIIRIFEIGPASILFSGLGNVIGQTPEGKAIIGKRMILNYNIFVGIDGRLDEKKPKESAVKRVSGLLEMAFFKSGGEIHQAKGFGSPRFLSLSPGVMLPSGENWFEMMHVLTLECITYFAK